MGKLTFESKSEKKSLESLAVSKTAEKWVIAVGIISILLAVLGLLSYLLGLFWFVVSDSMQDLDNPYFGPIFYVTSLICIGCYITLLVCGVKFVRLRTNVFKLFVGVVIFEVAYFVIKPLIISLIISHISSRSCLVGIFLATGLADGGLVFQFFILFPLWAPILVGWAIRKLRLSGELG